MATSPLKYQFPNLFKRIPQQTHPLARHLINLREKKSYRLEKKSVLLQGLRFVRQWRDDNQPIKSIIVTAMKDPHDEQEIKFPAIQVIQNPDAFQCEKYYLADVDLTRRILGTFARPGRHEVFAEIPIVEWPMPEKEAMDRLLIFNHVNDPTELGNLVRCAFGFGWKAGITTTSTTDLFNDQTIRTSGALSLRWPSRAMQIAELKEYLTNNDMTPVVLEELPENVQDLWSPEPIDAQNTQHTSQVPRLVFWNFNGKPQGLPKRPALIINASYHGVQGFNDELRLSIKTKYSKGRLDITSAGSIAMYELDRLLS